MMRSWTRLGRGGVSPLAALIWILVAAAFVYIIYALIVWYRSPSTVTISRPPSPVAIPIGGATTFTVTLTWNSAWETAGSTTVRIDEDDWVFSGGFDDVLDQQVLVSWGANSSTGTGAFVLKCAGTPAVLTGDDSYSEDETSYDVHAEFERPWLLLYNKKSDNITVTCGAPAPGAAAPAGAPAPGAAPGPSEEGN